MSQEFFEPQEQPEQKTAEQREEEELDRPTWEQRKDTAALEQRQQRERTATIEQMIDALAEQKKRHQRELEALEELQRNERLRAWQQRKAAEAGAKEPMPKSPGKPAPGETGAQKHKPRSSRSPQVARPSRP